MGDIHLRPATHIYKSLKPLFAFKSLAVTAVDIISQQFNILAYILSDVVCYVCLNTVLIKVCKQMRVSCANKPLNYLLTGVSQLCM